MKISILRNRNFTSISILIVGLAFIIIALSACSDKKETQTTKPVEETEKSPTDVELTNKQVETIGIELGSITMMNLNNVLKVNGFTEIPPQYKAEISTLLSGVVNNIMVTEGNFAKKGTVLATIQNLEVAELQEQYQTARANIEFLELEYERQKKLSDENVNPRKIFQEVKSKLTSERAKAQAAKNKLAAINVNPNGNSSNVPIIAPIDGYVSKINISRGAFANTGISLIEMVDNSKLHIDLNVFEKDIDKIFVGQEVTINFSNQENNPILGKIYEINKSFQDNTKSVSVHVAIDAQKTKNLIGGMYVNANINLSNELVPSLPNDAIVKNGEQHLIFIKDNSSHQTSNTIDDTDEIHFKSIEIVPGRSDLGFTEIKLTKEVDKNTQIVTKGAFYLLSQLKGGGSHDH